MADQQLSEGAIMTLLTGGEVLNPVLQVLGTRKISGNSANDRYRVLISDGVYCNSYAMLATQLNHMVENKQLEEFTIIRLKRHLTSMVSNHQQQKKGEKRIIIMLDVEVLRHGKEVGFKIGNPEACGVDGDKPLTNGAASRPPTTNGTQPQYRPPQSNTTASWGGRPATQSAPVSLGDNVKTHPIIGLSPYQNKWVIKARVTSKTPIRQWSNARGEGKLFSMDLTDESGEIRATAFKDQVDKFYEMIEVGKVYYFSKCQLKSANKKFSNLNNDYEMSFTNETQVVPCQNEDDTIPQVKFNFVPLPSLAETPSDTIVDIIGVCKNAGDVMTFTAKTSNRELKKREVTLVDHSHTAITLTLWGTQAEEFDGSTQPIVAVKGGRLQEFNGSKSVGLLNSSTLQLNPDIDESHKLRGWFDNFCQDGNITFNNISGRQGGDGVGAGGKWLLFKEVKDAQLGGGDKPDYFTTLAAVIHIRSTNCVYQACPTEGCQKKVIDQNNGYYRCEKCNREFDTFKNRFLVSAQLADWSGAQWVNLFHDQAQELFGVTADQVAAALEQSGGSVTDCFSNVLFREFLFRLRAKMETYNDETRLRVNAFSVKKPDIKEHCRRMISGIKEMAGIDTKQMN